MIGQQKNGWILPITKPTENIHYLAELYLVRGICSVIVNQTQHNVINTQKMSMSCKTYAPDNSCGHWALSHQDLHAKQPLKA